MTTLLQIPPQGVPVLAADGSMTDPWRRWFIAAVTRMGGISGGLQPADSTLDGLAGMNATAGLVVETAADIFTKRSLSGVAGRIVITNPAGVAGNPTVDLAPVAGVAGTHASPTSITVDAVGRITAIS